MFGEPGNARGLKAQLDWTQQQLRLIAERYVLATAAARVGVWDWNIKTGEFYLDPVIKGFLGYEDHEIPNDLDIWATYIHPDDRDAVMKAAADVIDGRAAEYMFEHRMLHKNGSVKWFMVRGKVIRNSLGRAERFVGTDTDITERRELERQVRELSNEIQTQIGHDLHDSLGQQLTGLSYSLRSLELEAAEQSLPYSEKARQARRLAEQAIEMTQSLSRGLSPVMSTAGLASSLRHLADTAKHLYGIDCNVDLTDELPKSFSRGPGNELYRIAQEAVTNAVKHGRATRVDIEARAVEDRFLLSIADNGTGFSAPEPGDSSMGLKIMHYRARHLGGSLTVSRRPEGGTLVICSCPSGDK